MDCINQFFAKNPVKTETQTAFLEALQKTHIHGSIETEGHVNYVIHTTPWNLRCQPKPLALVYANTADDVAAVVKLAAQYGIPIQPRSGGHSYASYSLGGTSGSLVVDLAAMDKVVVDQKTWRATIGPGTRLKGVNEGLLKQGKRTIAHGVGLQVGMGGHATVGGQGPLARMYGLTIDHVVEMEVVLADGSIVRANATENADLFWVMNFIYLACCCPLICYPGTPWRRGVVRHSHLLHGNHASHPNKCNALLLPTDHGLTQ
jgi:FAD binding domain